MKQLLLFASILLFGSSCNFDSCGFNKKSFLSKHEYWVDNVKKNRKSWNEKDWEKSDAAMKDLIENCYEKYEDELTNEESMQFWKGTASYYVRRIGKGYKGELKNMDEEISKALEKGISAIKSDPEGFLREILKESGGDEFKESLKTLGNEVKKLGEQFDEWLNQ